MADVAATKERVQTLLTSEGPVQLERSGAFSLPAGSTRVFVEVREHANGKATVVQVWAIIAWEVPRSPELFEYIAMEGGRYFFGHLTAWDDDDVQGTVDVAMRHTLLGDYLDKEELLYAVYGIAGSADELDDDFVARFGGRVFAS